MSENKKITVNGDELNHHSDSSADEKRRQILKGSLAVPPVVMSIMGKPAFGGHPQCGLSGQLSGNLSDADVVCGGEGCTPGYYKNHRADLGAWHQDLQPDLLYSNVFGIDPFPGKTLGQVIGYCGEEQVGVDDCNQSLLGACTPTSACENLFVQLGFHSVAALQNAALANVSYDLTVVEVVQQTYNAYYSGDKNTIDTFKTDLDDFNNQGCPMDGGNINCNKK
ncbi:MAG: hypothetical protein KAI22_11440 [Gammaproteobacteria bacterium]|nr:hypothetical protein [Gammaproteobacteria bacterium]